MGFAFGIFESEEIGFEICFVILCYIPIVFNLVGIIAFLTFGPMNVICKYGVFPLWTILVLRNARIYVSASDSDNIWTNVETPVETPVD